jgi:hypothetical protein
LQTRSISVLTSQAGAKFNTTPAHGKSFQQLWLDLWRKYARAPHLATSNRKDKKGVDVACKALLRLIDSTMALRPRRLISQLDPEAAYRMRFAHQPIARAAVNGVDKLQES